jgi:Zn-dependent peptidase ImmA (M78 family)
MNATHRQIEDLLRGHQSITLEIAHKLESHVGATSNFWLNRERQYRIDLERLSTALDETWLSELPCNDMKKFGWIASSQSSEELQRRCLDFFNVPNVASWRSKYQNSLESVAFRTSYTYTSDSGAVAAWLRQGELEAETIGCSPWDAKKFSETLSNTIRPLTRQREPATFLPELKRLCAACGVAVVIVRAPKGCRASGATKFVSDEKAVLYLSFRYLSDDHFWFTFFHEAGHLLLHGKEALFLEGSETISNVEEQEANDFAANSLVPPNRQQEMKALRASDWRQIARFAKSVGVSAGIVVGQLQHFGMIRPNQLNDLKIRYKWAAD